MRKLWQGLRSVDGRIVLALVYTACLLTVLEYWYLPERVQSRMTPAPEWAAPMQWYPTPSLEAGLTWVVACIIGFLVIPLLVTLTVHRDKPRSIGFTLAGFHFHLWIYLGLYAVMVPLILMVADRPDFQRVYPFVPTATQSMGNFIRWEVGYLAQFFALESFFRGYLLFTLEKRIGWNAIFVMAVPYCMIHWHKPPEEAFAAVIAGVVLGALALRFRSWVGGALLHALVALTMDLLAAHRAGLF